MLGHPEDEEMPFVRMKFGDRGLIIAIGLHQLREKDQNVNLTASVISVTSKSSVPESVHCESSTDK